MKKFASMVRNNKQAKVYFAFAVLLSGTMLMAQPFRLSGTSDLIRVFEDGYKLPVMKDTIKLFGIRGEIISGQCVIIARNSLSEVSVAAGMLKDQVTGGSLAAETVDWNFVGCVPLTSNTTNQPVSALCRPAPASYPEYLMTERKINIREKSYKAIWLTIDIPEHAKAGTYNGSIWVRSLQGEQSLPLCLTVYPFTLPAERHLKVTEWYSTEGFAHFHGIDQPYSEAWFAMLRRYAENMAAHRQNVFMVPVNSIKIRQLENGTFEFDFSLFDSIARVFWDTGQMNYLETGFLTKFGKGDWFSTEISLKDVVVYDVKTGTRINTAGKEVIPYLLQALENHLRQIGWLERTLFHVKDEPSLHNALAWEEMSSYIHHYAPDLRRIDAIETTFLLDDIDVAVPKLDALGSWYESYRKWQQKGNELWFYTVGIYQGSYYPNKTIDMPLMDSRIMHWLNYRYDITGYLHWGWNQWTDDPYKDTGMHCGDGWHVYPVKDGVLNSLRWEEMRNGIQDYEYFRMLEDRITALKDSLGSRFAWIDPKQRGKEIAARVVKSLSEHSDDPQVLYEAKLEIIRELQGLDTPPRMYVQTDPMVHSPVTDQSSVAVFGWTETGTKIMVNGQELPVSPQGLFLEQYVLSPEESKIVIEASSPHGSKVIVREFTIR